MARAFGPGRQTKGGVPGVCRMGAEQKSAISGFDNRVSLLLYP